MNPQSHQGQHRTCAQAFDAYKRIQDLLQTNNDTMNKLADLLVNRANQHKEEYSWLKANFARVSDKDKLRIIQFIQEKFHHQIKGFRLLQDAGFQCSSLISHHESFFQFCNQAKPWLQERIKMNEQLDNERHFLEKEKEEGQTKLANILEEIADLQQKVHKQQGKYRVLCRIMPSPPLQPGQKRPVIIKRNSAFQIELRHKKTGHDQPHSSTQMVLHHVDFAFPQEVKQVQIFFNVLYMLKAAFSGEKCSIMVYGTNDTGKSYTMHGKTKYIGNYPLDEDSGLVQRIIEKALEMRDKELQKGNQMKITIQFFEKGATKPKENTSLSKPKQPKIEGKKCRTSQSVPKESHKVVSKKKQYVLEDIKSSLSILNKQIAKREVAKKGNNNESSRSHFCIILRVLDSKQKQIGFLSLIDLAGHQSINDDNIKEDKQTSKEIQKEANLRQIETNFINTSLTEVSTVLRQIRHNQKVQWGKYPQYMRYMKPYLGSRGIVIVTFSWKQTRESANRASMRFIDDIR